MRLYRADDGSTLHFPAFFASTRAAASQYGLFHQGSRVRVFEFEPQSALVMRAEPETPEEYLALFDQAEEMGYDSIHWPNFEVGYDQWVVLRPDNLVELPEDELERVRRRRFN